MSCCVPYCDSAVITKKTPSKYKKGVGSKISFHQFPNVLELMKKWIVAIGRKDPRTGKYWIPYKNSVVCGLHFSPRQFNPKTGVLIKGSIPYIFPDYSLPEYGTLIDEKELALVNLTEEEYAKIVRRYYKKKKKREKAEKIKNKPSDINNAFSITDSTDKIEKTKKRSFLEINSGDDELFEKNTNVSRKLSKRNVIDDESDEGTDCGLPNSDEIPISDDEFFETNKNNSSTDNTKQTFCTVNSSQFVEKGNDPIVVYKETDFNKSKTDSAIKIVELSLSVSKNNHTSDKAKQQFHIINDKNIFKNNIQTVNKETISNESKTDPAIKMIKIPLSLTENNKNFKIQIPSNISLNESSSSSPNTFTVPSANTHFHLLPIHGNNNSTVLMTQRGNMTILDHNVSKNIIIPSSKTTIDPMTILGHNVSKNIIIPSSKTTIEPTPKSSENGNLPGIKSTIVINDQSKYQELFKHTNNVTKPVKESIIQPIMVNITEKDKQQLNNFKAETAENKILTMELLQLQEKYENLLSSDESLQEKISLYNIEELKTGIANVDRKASFLYDQLCSLTEEKTVWSECTMEFADKLEENLPACHNFLRKTDVISLPPPKQERENSAS